MARIVRIDEDLHGQTLDAEARESLFLRCNIDGVTFRGDWRGSDYLNTQGAADWSRALTYASYWRGCRDLSGSKFPPDIGWLHHEPVGTIIKDAIAGLSGDQTLKERVGDVADFVLTTSPTASWETSVPLWWASTSPTSRPDITEMFHRIFAPYRQLAERFEGLATKLEKGTPLWDGTLKTALDVTWPDGAKVHLDGLNLPALPDPSRYTLARWVEREADAQTGPPHHLFLFSTLPPRPMIMAPGKTFLNGYRGGY